MLRNFLDVKKIFFKRSVIMLLGIISISGATCNIEAITRQIRSFSDSYLLNQPSSFFMEYDEENFGAESSTEDLMSEVDTASESGKLAESKSENDG